MLGEPGGGGHRAREEEQRCHDTKERVQCEFPHRWRVGTVLPSQHGKEALRRGSRPRKTPRLKRDTRQPEQRGTAKAEN